MLTIFLIVLAALVAALLIYAATRPDAFRIERTVAIRADADRVFPFVNDLRANARWMPWDKLDPAMRRTYSTDTVGPGASYEWSGNNKAGAGRITITDAVSPSRVALDLEMLKPFRASNKVDFTIRPNIDGCNVTWAMSGSQPFFVRLMCVFVDCDAMIGKDFENGLASLKNLAETPA